MTAGAVAWTVDFCCFGIGCVWESRLELKKSIEAGHIIRQESVDKESGRGAGITNVQSLRVWFTRWETQAGGHEQILSWPPERKKSFLEEVRPIVELAREMEATLA